MPTTKLIEKAQQIVLNNQDDIQEIIGHPPGWLLRWGITIVLLAVLIFGFMSWLIKYPDVLAAPVIITTENPAIRVVAKTSGKLEELYVQNQDTVKEGQIIALIESAADWKDIEQLQHLISEVEQSDNLLKIDIPENLSVGTLQTGYAQLVQQLKDQQNFLREQLDQVKQQAATNQIKHYKQLNEGLERQISIFEKEVALVKDKYQRNYKLYEEGAISLLELQDLETNYLQYQRQLEGLASQKISNQVTIEQLRTQIADVQQNRKNGLNTRSLVIEENCRQTKNDIKNWEQTYLVKAPINGQISMNKVWSNQQFIQINTEIFTIVPQEGAGEIIAKAMMPTLGIGKVKTGMVANINLDGYPQEEYGILKSKVQEIALLPELNRNTEEVSYQLKLELQNGLSTTYNKQISLNQEMSGTAEIITEEKRIIERVFYQIQNILKNN